jgi:hypothetical protein
MSKRKTRSSTKGTNKDIDGDEEPQLKKSKITQDNNEKETKDGKETKKSIIPVDQQESLLANVELFGQPNEEMSRAFRWLIALDVQDHHNRRHKCVQLGELTKNKDKYMAMMMGPDRNDKTHPECGKIIFNVEEYLLQFRDMKPQVYYHELIELVKDKVTVEYSFSNGDCVDPHNTAVVFPETAWIWTDDSGRIVSYSIEFLTLGRLSMRVFEQGKLPMLSPNERDDRLANKGLATTKRDVVYH